MTQPPDRVARFLRYAELVANRATYELEADPDHPGFYLVRDVPVFAEHTRGDMTYGPDDLTKIVRHHGDLGTTRHYVPIFEGHHGCGDEECRPKVGNLRNFRMGQVEIVSPDTHEVVTLQAIFADLGKVKVSYARRMLDGDLEYRSVEIYPGTPRISGLALTSTVPPWFKFSNLDVRLAEGVELPEGAFSPYTAISAKDKADGKLALCYAERMAVTSKTTIPPEADMPRRRHILTQAVAEPTSGGPLEFQQDGPSARQAYAHPAYEMGYNFAKAHPDDADTMLVMDLRTGSLRAIGGWLLRTTGSQPSQEAIAQFKAGMEQALFDAGLTFTDSRTPQRFSFTDTTGRQSYATMAELKEEIGAGGSVVAGEIRSALDKLVGGVAVAASGPGLGVGLVSALTLAGVAPGLAVMVSGAAATYGVHKVLQLVSGAGFFAEGRQPKKYEAQSWEILFHAAKTHVSQSLSAGLPPIDVVADAGGSAGRGHLLLDFGVENPSPTDVATFQSEVEEELWRRGLLTDNRQTKNYQIALQGFTIFVVDVEGQVWDVVSGGDLLGSFASVAEANAFAQRMAISADKVEHVTAEEYERRQGLNFREERGMPSQTNYQATGPFDRDQVISILEELGFSDAIAQAEKLAGAGPVGATEIAEATKIQMTRVAQAAELVGAKMGVRMGERGGKAKYALSNAEGWIDTDRGAAHGDVIRLGLEGAVQFNMDLVSDALDKGDLRWSGITEADMREALQMLMEEFTEQHKRGTDPMQDITARGGKRRYADRDVWLARQQQAFMSGDWDGRPPSDFAMEFFNNGDADVEADGSVWTGRAWADENQLTSFVQWLRPQLFTERTSQGSRQMQDVKERRRMYRELWHRRQKYALADLQAMPTLSTSQSDALKIDTGTKRVWLSTEARAKFTNPVTVEELKDGRWIVTGEFEAFVEGAKPKTFQEEQPAEGEEPAEEPASKKDIEEKAIARVEALEATLRELKQILGLIDDAGDEIKEEVEEEVAADEGAAPDEEPESPMATSEARVREELEDLRSKVDASNERVALTELSARLRRGNYSFVEEDLSEIFTGSLLDDDQREKRYRAYVRTLSQTPGWEGLDEGARSEGGILEAYADDPVALEKAAAIVATYQQDPLLQGWVPLETILRQQVPGGRWPAHNGSSHQ